MDMSRMAGRIWIGEMPFGFAGIDNSSAASTLFLSPWSESEEDAPGVREATEIPGLEIELVEGREEREGDDGTRIGATASGEVGGAI